MTIVYMKKATKKNNETARKRHCLRDNRSSGANLLSEENFVLEIYLTGTGPTVKETACPGKFFSISNLISFQLSIKTTSIKEENFSYENAF